MGEALVVEIDQVLVPDVLLLLRFCIQFTKKNLFRISILKIVNLQYVFIPAISVFYL